MVEYGCQVGKISFCQHIGTEEWVMLHVSKITRVLQELYNSWKVQSFAGESICCISIKIWGREVYQNSQKPLNRIETGFYPTVNCSVVYSRGELTYLYYSKNLVLRWKRIVEWIANNECQGEKKDFLPAHCYRWGSHGLRVENDTCHSKIL